MSSSIAIATIRTSAVYGLRLAVQAAALLLVARLLGPQQFGAFAGVTALALFLGTLSTFGTHLVLLGGMSKDLNQRTRILSYAFPMTLLCGSVLLIVFLLVCTLVLNESGIGWDILIIIGVADLLLQPLLAFAVAELLATERTARSQILQILPMILRTLVAIGVFAWQPADPLSAYGYGYGVATVIALIMAIAYLPQIWLSPHQWRMPAKSELYESASFAALNITAIGPAELDKVLAAKLLPLSSAGLYAAGARMVGAITLPVVALMLSSVPRLFREGRTQVQRTTRLLRWIFAATLLYSVALALLLWWLAPLFVLLLGDKYQGVDEVVQWLCIAVPGMTLRIAAGSTLMALGQPWMRAGFELCGAAVLTIAAIALTKAWGMHGMVLTLAFSEWTMALLGIGLVIRCQQRLSTGSTA